MIGDSVGKETVQELSRDVPSWVKTVEDMLHGLLDRLNGAALILEIPGRKKPQS